MEMEFAPPLLVFAPAHGTMEEDMKKIGVVTLYANTSIGNRLQAYASMQLYRSLGYDVTAVNHMEEELLEKQTLIERIKLAVKVALFRVNPNLRCLRNYRRHLQSNESQNLELAFHRKQMLSDFSETYVSPSETVSIKCVPPDLKAHYDFFSVGSDQVWRNWTGTPEELRFFFLHFADRRQRLCLASSFGLESVPKNNKEIYRKGLNGFPRLSCREASGVKLIRNLIGRDAALLLDPTMCLPISEWKHLERKPDYPLPERYVLSYMLSGLTPEMEDAVSYYVRLLHMDVINIDDVQPFTEHCAATGPQEFLYLVRHASFVCTSSFHGTVFSILFRRNFVCFNQKDPGKRITTLLHKFHLASRCYGVLRDEDLLSTDYAGTEETLSKEHKRMLAYLREALADNGES